MEQPSVSIVTAVLNRAHTIERCIRSVGRQEYDDVEYVVVDGGSDDGTLELLGDYRTEIDVVISEPDEGIYDAMNKGITLSSGSVIGILNSDDWYDPDTVSEVVAAFRRDPSADVVAGAMRVWNQAGESVEAFYGANRCMPVTFTAPMNHPAMFVKRHVYERLGLYDQRFPTAADYDFMLRLLKAGANVVCCSRVVVNFRQGGATSDFDWAPYSQIMRVFRKNDIPVGRALSGIVYRQLRDAARAVLPAEWLRTLRQWLGWLQPYRVDGEAETER